MSIPTGVDGDAPVRAHHETDINAPLDTVWQLHADVNAWPAWQTDITAAHIDRAFQPGASFEWTSYGFTVVSTIYAVAERARVLRGGTADGITGVHSLELPVRRARSAQTRVSRSRSPVAACPAPDAQAALMRRGSSPGAGHSPGPVTSAPARSSSGGYPATREQVSSQHSSGGSQHEGGSRDAR